LSSRKDPRWNASGETASGDPLTLSQLAQQALQALRAGLGEEPPDDLTTEVKVTPGAEPAPEAETGIRDQPPEPAIFAIAPDPSPPAPVVRSAAPGRCPTCGQRVLPRQSRCLQCNTRLHEPVVPAADAEEAPSPIPVAADGGCPGCGRPLAADAVLCIECGYDLRTGKRRQTRHTARVVEREVLPRSLAQVRLGLGFGYARAVVFLLLVVLLLGVFLYARATALAPEHPDTVILLASLAFLVLTAVWLLLGVAGAVLCAFVPRGCGARWLIVTSLVLDLAAIPAGVYLGLRGGVEQMAWAQLVSMGIFLAGWILFMLYLRQLAVYLDQGGPAHDAGGILVWGLVVAVAVPLLVVLLFLLAMLSTIPVPVFWFGVAVLVFGDLFLLLRLVFSLLRLFQDLREVISRGLSSAQG
jgi:hypothetical protein